MSKNQEKVLQSMGLMDKDKNIIQEEEAEKYLNDPPKKSVVSRIFGFLFDIVTLRFLFKKKQVAKFQKKEEINNGEVKKVSTEEIEKEKLNAESKVEEKGESEEKTNTESKTEEKNEDKDKEEKDKEEDSEDKENKIDKKEESSEKEM